MSEKKPEFKLIRLVPRYDDWRVSNNNSIKKEKTLVGYIAEYGYPSNIVGMKLLSPEKTVLTEMYSEISTYHGHCAEDFYYAEKNGKMGILGLNGKEIVPCMYDDVQHDGNYFCVTLNLFPGSDVTHYVEGMIDRNGSIIISPRYDKISCVWPDPAFSFFKKTEDEKLLDSDRFIITKIIDENNAIYFDDFTTKEALIDREEKIVIPFCDAIIPAAEGRHFICREGKEYSFFDSAGNMLKESITADSLEYCWRRNLFIFSKGGRKGAVTDKGEVLIPDIYELIESTSWEEPYIWAKIEGVFVLYDAITGDKVIDERSKITEVGSFYRHLCPCMNSKNKCGVVNNCGETVIPFEYDGWGVRVKDGIVMNKGNLWGAVSYNNSLIIPFLYDDPFDFDNSYEWEIDASVMKQGGNCGIILSSGRVIVDPIYDDIESDAQLGADEALYRLIGKKKGLVFIARKKNKYYCIEIDEEKGVLTDVSLINLDEDLHEYIHDYYL